MLLGFSHERGFGERMRSRAACVVLRTALASCVASAPRAPAAVLLARLLQHAAEATGFGSRAGSGGERRARTQASWAQVVGCRGVPNAADVRAMPADPGAVLAAGWRAAEAGGRARSSPPHTPPVNARCFPEDSPLSWRHRLELEGGEAQAADPTWRCRRGCCFGIGINETSSKSTASPPSFTVRKPVVVGEDELAQPVLIGLRDRLGRRPGSRGGRSARAARRPCPCRADARSGSSRRARPCCRRPGS